MALFEPSVGVTNSLESYRTLSRCARVSRISGKDQITADVTAMMKGKDGAAELS